MADQEQKRRSAPRRNAAEDTDAEGGAGGAAAARLAADMDDLLDEIDDVLEVNAEEFVRSYVQKGGQ